MEPVKLKKGIDYTGIAIVFACHDGKGKFLFAQRGENVRDGQGLWEMPAGGVKYGETIRDGLLRELREEICAEPIMIEETGYKDVIEKDGDKVLKHWVAFEFLVQVDPVKVRIGEPDKCVALEWREIDDVPGPLHYGTKETIENIIAFQKSKTSN